MVEATTESNSSINRAESDTAPAKDDSSAVSFFELCLVVLVAFGKSIWSSLYLLFGHLPSPETAGGIYEYGVISLRGVSILALLAYVLCARREAGHDAGTAGSLWLSWPRWLGCRFRRPRWYELGLVLLIILNPVIVFLPIVGLSHLGWLAEDPGLLQRLHVNAHELAQVLRKAIALGVVACVLHRGGRSFANIGLQWSLKVAGLALPLFLCHDLFARIDQPLTFWLGRTLTGPGWQPPDIDAMIYPAPALPLLAFGEALINGFFEELIVRAYVMTEVIRLTQKVWLAVVISVSLQISYHFYQGIPFALSHIPIFTLFALFYARTRCILPVAIAHSLGNLRYTLNHGLETLLP